MYRAYTSEGSGTIAEARATSFVLDSASDVQDLPVYPAVMPGSTAIDANTGNVYILNASGDTWCMI